MARSGIYTTAASNGHFWMENANPAAGTKMMARSALPMTNVPLHSAGVFAKGQLA